MSALDFLFVCRCKLCDAPLKHGSVCPECDGKLKELVFVSNRKIQTQDGTEYPVSYLFDYDNELVIQLLFALKESADRELFEYAARLYEIVLPSGFCGIVTNVPRRKVNKRMYGYDHVEVPCKILSKNSGGSIRYQKLLKRVGFSKDQKTLSADERKKNVANKFKATKKDITDDILLVDDVLTTGNSIISCIEQIKKCNPHAKIFVCTLSSKCTFPCK